MDKVFLVLGNDRSFPRRVNAFSDVEIQVWMSQTNAGGMWMVEDREVKSRVIVGILNNVLFGGGWLGGFTNDLTLFSSLKVACKCHSYKLDCISSFGKLSN